MIIESRLARPQSPALCMAPPEDFTEITDERLGELAREWRRRAGRGDPEAFGVAHVLEVEQRRRAKVGERPQLAEPLAEPPRSRWRFWKAIWPLRSP